MLKIILCLYILLSHELLTKYINAKTSTPSLTPHSIFTRKNEMFSKRKTQESLKIHSKIPDREKRVSHHGTNHHHSVIMKLPNFKSNKNIIVKHFNKKFYNSTRAQQSEWKKRHIAFEAYAQNLNLTNENNTTAATNRNTKSSKVENDKLEIIYKSAHPCLDSIVSKGNIIDALAKVLASHVIKTTTQMPNVFIRNTPENITASNSWSTEVIPTLSFPKLTLAFTTPRSPFYTAQDISTEAITSTNNIAPFASHSVVKNPNIVMASPRKVITKVFIIPIEEAVPISPVQKIKLSDKTSKRNQPKQVKLEKKNQINKELKTNKKIDSKKDHKTVDKSKSRNKKKPKLTGNEYVRYIFDEKNHHKDNMIWKTENKRKTNLDDTKESNINLKYLGNKAVTKTKRLYCKSKKSSKGNDTVNLT